MGDRTSKLVMSLFPQIHQDIEDIYAVISSPTFSSPSLSHKHSQHKSFCLEMELEDFIIPLELSAEKDDQDYYQTQEPVRLPLETPRTRRIAKPRYQKNLCGYILKKVLRAFISQSYRNVAGRTCLKHGASYEEARVFCLSKVEKVSGPSHLQMILVPSTREQFPLKQALADFMEWFLRERYVRHLVLDGKMSQKGTYVLFKNNFFPKEMELCQQRTRMFMAET